jgi:hypothetical protein
VLPPKKQENLPIKKGIEKRQIPEEFWEYHPCSLYPAADHEDL